MIPLYILIRRSGGKQHDVKLLKSIGENLSEEAVTITATLAAQIMDATGVQMSLIHTNCEAHKTSIEKATDLYDYDISTGWPDVFR